MPDRRSIGRSTATDHRRSASPRALARAAGVLLGPEAASGRRTSSFSRSKTSVASAEEIPADRAVSSSRAGIAAFYPALARAPGTLPPGDGPTGAHRNLMRILVTGAGGFLGSHVVERLRAVDKLVVVGTICSYPKLAPLPFKEESLWDGYPEETNAPYGVAKKSLLVGGQAYREQYGLNAIHLLLVNMYGPRDNFDLENSHVVPALIRKMLESSGDIVLWGDGSATREFLYVEDAAEALWLAGRSYDGAEPINIGSGEEISIRELAELVADVTGFGGEILWDTSKPNGQPRRRLDVSKAHELFGFGARTSLREGIEQTVAWYCSRVAAGAAR